MPKGALRLQKEGKKLNFEVYASKLTYCLKNAERSTSPTKRRKKVKKRKNFEVYASKLTYCLKNTERSTSPIKRRKKVKKRKIFEVYTSKLTYCLKNAEGSTLLIKRRNKLLYVFTKLTFFYRMKGCFFEGRILFFVRRMDAFLL